MKSIVKYKIPTHTLKCTTKIRSKVTKKTNKPLIQCYLVRNGEGFNVYRETYAIRVCRTSNVFELQWCTLAARRV